MQTSEHNIQRQPTSKFLSEDFFFFLSLRLFAFSGRVGNGAMEYE